LPLPEVNVRLAGWMVDALWPEQRVVVELDGHQNHRSPAQIERDRRKDLELRAAGFIVLRYTWTQVIQQPGLVIADLRAALGDRAA
jgi:very-short-patch-repair endonuclease